MSIYTYERDNFCKYHLYVYTHEILLTANFVAIIVSFEVCIRLEIGRNAISRCLCKLCDAFFGISVRYFFFL